MWTLRLGVFPSWIIYTTTVEAAHVRTEGVNTSFHFQLLFQLIQMIPVYYIFNSLFSILLVLHIIWFYYIVKIAYKVNIIKFAYGKRYFKTLATGVTEDARSDTDSADDEMEEEEIQKTKKQ